MAVHQSEAFKQAMIDAKKLKSKPTTDDLLTLYGLFRTSVGDDISQEPKPGLLDIKGKVKKSAWQKVVDSGITPAEAQEKHIAHVQSLKEKYGFDEDKEPEALDN